MKSLSFPTVCMLVMAVTAVTALLPWWAYSSDWTYWPAAGLVVAILGVLALLLRKCGDDAVDQASSAGARISFAKPRREIEFEELRF